MFVCMLLNPALEKKGRDPDALNHGHPKMIINGLTIIHCHKEECVWNADLSTPWRRGGVRTE